MASPHASGLCEKLTLGQRQRRLRPWEQGECASLRQRQSRWSSARPCRALPTSLTKLRSHHRSEKQPAGDSCPNTHTKASPRPGRMPVRRCRAHAAAPAGWPAPTVPSLSWVHSLRAGARAAILGSNRSAYTARIGARAWCSGSFGAGSARADCRSRRRSTGPSSGSLEGIKSCQIRHVSS